jgi:biotin synthase
MSTLKNNWTKQDITELFEFPFNDLMFKAHCIHRENFDPNHIQISTLLSIKTGACPEDCAYCSQSSRNDAALERERLLPLDEVIEQATQAKANGASRFCMGAAWRNPTDKNLEKVIDMIKGVKSLGMETCVTLGMLTKDQTLRLKQAGLDYYNHNLDTSPEFYDNIITTRTFEDRLNTLEHVRDAEINVCSGGILGMGEAREDRVSLLHQLATLPNHPESVPINMLVQIEGTPLNGIEKLDPLEFVRTIAVARILMPESAVRLSAGRMEMSDETQALCFFAGANSIFYGDKLLTTDNPESNHDQKLFNKLGINTLASEVEKHETTTAS